MGKPIKDGKEAIFQPSPWETPDLALQHGWAPLLNMLKRAGVPKRTFELWRECRLVPPGIKPAVWRKPKGRGGFIVLWPPEVESFLMDAHNMSQSLHMRGQSNPGFRQTPASSHAALRIGLWIRGWGYESTLIRETFDSVIDQFGQLLTRRFILSDLARWLYASARVYKPTGVRDDPNQRRPRRAWEVESVWRFILFTHRIHSWVGVTPSAQANKISAFWMGKGKLAAADLKSFLRDVNDDELDRLRNGWRKILDALMFQSPPSPFSVEPSLGESSLEIGLYQQSLETDLIWQAIQGLDKDAYHVTTADEVERWTVQWEKIKHTIPEEKRANITFVGGSAWNSLTGQRVAELERTYRPTNFIGAIAKLLKYLGVMMLLIAGHQGTDVVTEGAASQPYEPTKGMFCPCCHVALEPEPGWPPLWERLRKPRPIEQQRCPSCLAVWIIPEDSRGREVFYATNGEVTEKNT